MSFDIDKEASGEWFDFFESRADVSTGEIIYDDPEDGAAEFCIRHPGPFFEKQLNATKKESKMVLNPKTRQMEHVSFYPDLPPEEAQREREDVVDYSIVDWRNAKRPDGSEIECNRENKLKMKKIPVFDRFLGRVWEILESAGVKHKEDSEKNLSTG